jgi:hypothetical protein
MVTSSEKVATKIVNGYDLYMGSKKIPLQHQQRRWEMDKIANCVY